MPASSISALNSWGAYVIAAAALALVLAPTLNGLYVQSREAADARNLEGVLSVVDGLRPGMKVNLTFAGGTGSDPIALRGRTAACGFQGWSLVLPIMWPANNSILDPSAKYALWLEQGHLEVSRLG